MDITKREFIYKEYHDDLLAQLMGKVFHVTSREAFNSIQKDEFIFNNKGERFLFNVGSNISLGRKRGWVCFFDLRNISDEDLRWTLDKYYFLKPSWFDCYTEDDTITELAYLALNDVAMSKIISIKQVREQEKQSIIREQYVPEAEVWFPGDVSTELIKETLLVKIQRRAPKDNAFMYAHHMNAYQEQRENENARKK